MMYICRGFDGRRSTHRTDDVYWADKCGKYSLSVSLVAFLWLALLVQKEHHCKYKCPKSGHDLWVGHPDPGGHSDRLLVIIYRLVCRIKLQILKTVDKEGSENECQQAGLQRRR